MARDAKCEECGKRLTWEYPGVAICEKCEDYLEHGDNRPYSDPFRPSDPVPYDWDH